MIYQCVYCKATYNHDQSYKHNAYDCPKVRGKAMKAGLIGLLALCLVGLTGCDTLRSLLPQEKMPSGVDKVELILYKGTQTFHYECQVDITKNALTDCQEVK